jgi:hypothetical protein
MDTYTSRFYYNYVVLLNRETLEFSHVFGQPSFYGGQVARSTAAAINQLDGSLWVYWTKSGSPYTPWISRFYPDGSREDWDMSGALSTMTYPEDCLNALTYDSDTNQLVLGEYWSYRGESRLWFINCDDMSLAGKTADGTGPAISDYGIAEYQRGVVNGYFYYVHEVCKVGHTVKLFRVDIATREVETLLEWDIIDEDECMVQSLYVAYKSSIFVALNRDGIELYEILLGRITPNSVRLADIVTDLAKRAGLTAGQLNVAQLTDEVRGFTVTDNRNVRRAIEDLQDVFVFDAAEVDGLIHYYKRGLPSVATIPEVRFRGAPL